jgi:triphosphoribosyl-dephospho-CoA synthase
MSLRSAIPIAHESVTAVFVADAAQLACLLEASAPKPGNVSPGRHFAEARYEDFLASAVAIRVPLSGAGTWPLGVTIRLAIEATLRWTRSNTNLGMVLLLAPIARAALVEHRPVGRPGGKDGIERGVTAALRDDVRRVLEATTVDDAREAYAAIRLAAPGGLGRVDVQDVGDDPTMTLLDVMRLAADRDGIAREYATAFDVTFEIGVPALRRARSEGLSWDDAIVETFLTLLAANPDTHVARRGGTVLAAEISQRARSVLQADGVRSPAGRQAIEEMDRDLRDAHHAGNPGTTADLTAATLFVVLLGGSWAARGQP